MKGWVGSGFSGQEASHKNKDSLEMPGQYMSVANLRV